MFCGILRYRHNLLVDDTLGGGYELTTEQKDMLEDIKDSIKNAVPNYDELVRPDEEQGMEQMM